MEFKIGQKVVCIEPDPSQDLYPGTYTVERYKKNVMGEDLVVMAELPNGYYPYRFRISVNPDVIE
jgi:hypothetical protein